MFWLHATCVTQWDATIDYFEKSFAKLKNYLNFLQLTCNFFVLSWMNCAHADTLEQMKSSEGFPGE